MSGFAGKFDSVKQEWETPWDFFKPIDNEFHFTLDAAADENNTKVVNNYFTESDDGLSKDWGKNVVWINPPYGKNRKPIKAWVKKAYEESLKGATCVLLIPSRTNTTWFHDLCVKHAEIRFVKGRPKFIGCKHGLPQPLVLIIFRGKDV